MDLETRMVSLEVDGRFEDELNKLKAEGWQLRTDVPIVQVMHLVRPKPAAPGGGMEGAMKIDEDRVFVMGADGVIRKN